MLVVPTAISRPPFARTSFIFAALSDMGIDANIQDLGRNGYLITFRGSNEDKQELVDMFYGEAQSEEQADDWDDSGRMNDKGETFQGRDKRGNFVDGKERTRSFDANQTTPEQTGSYGKA